MPRCNFVKKARKDVPNSDIKAGESYYWWKFKRGGKYVSRTPPRRSQLTRSSFLGQIYDIEDQIRALTADSGLPDEIANIAQALRDLGSECEDSKNNMPDHLQEGDTGQLLDSRKEGCETAADELDAIETDYTPSDDVDDEADEDEQQQDAEDEEQEHWDRVLEEVQAVSIE